MDFFTHDRFAFFFFSAMCPLCPSSLYTDQTNYRCVRVPTRNPGDCTIYGRRAMQINHFFEVTACKSAHYLLKFYIYIQYLILHLPWISQIYWWRTDTVGQWPNFEANGCHSEFCLWPVGVGRFVTFLTSLFNILHFWAYEIHLWAQKIVNCVNNKYPVWLWKKLKVLTNVI